jgi:hypothetical protein
MRPTRSSEDEAQGVLAAILALEAAVPMGLFVERGVPVGRDRKGKRRSSRPRKGSTHP